MAEVKDEGEFLGVHTCIPPLIKSSFAEQFFHGNKKLPPYVITTGNGERVRKALKYLDEGVLLKDVMRSLNLKPFRVEIAVGLYKGTPIMIFEHQIGGPATEIYLKELLSDECMTYKYKVKSTNKTFHSPAKYLVRLGTALGINDIKNKKITVNVGDISVATRQIGITSNDFQAISSNLNIMNYSKSFKNAQNLLRKIGYSMQNIPNENDEKELWPIIDFDGELNKTLSKCISKNLYGNKKKYKCVDSLGNVSKDSLYAEKAPDTFIRLREKALCGTSDMEAATIIRTTKEMNHEFNNKIKTAFCSVILGTLPGDSFSDVDTSYSAKVQWISTLDALHSISQNHCE